MTDDFDADGHIPVRNGKGALFQVNPADRFESIQKRSDVPRRDFRLQEFAFFAVPPLDDSGVELAEARLERDVRITKVQQKISGAFRSARGANIFCRIRGNISTVRKNSLSVINTIQAAFERNPFMPACRDP